MTTLIITLASTCPLLAVILAVAAAIIDSKNRKKTTQVIVETVNNMKQEVLDTKEYQTLKEQLIIVNQENAKLKQQINELLTAIDKIRRGGDEDGSKSKN